MSEGCSQLVGGLRGRRVGYGMRPTSGKVYRFARQLELEEGFESLVAARVEALLDISSLKSVVPTKSKPAGTGLLSAMRYLGLCEARVSQK